MKKIEFIDLKIGQKFRFDRQLFIKDSSECGTCLSSGVVSNDIRDDTLVIPVKIKFLVK